MSFFILMFCASGLILNHRNLVAGCDVSRKALPAAYRIRNYNNGVVKGTVSLDGDSVLLFGNTGVMKGDQDLNTVRDFSSGFPEGVDLRNVRNIVRTRESTLYCAARSGLYRHDGRQWRPVALPGNRERVSDVALTEDSTGVVVLTRSDVYASTPSGSFRKLRLMPAAGQEKKVTLFKTVWHLHSGQLFGLPGILVVDAVAIVMIFLCVTGIIIFILPYSIRRSAAAKVKRKAAVMKWNFRWHNSVGYWTVVLTLLIAVTGTFLRPPLMVPLVLGKSAPVPGTVMDSDNLWHDRLRAIRWDSARKRWLLSTSDGFFTVDRDFRDAPRDFGNAIVPPVSPMGVNVLIEKAPGEWLVGSFTGMYVWEPDSGRVTDWFTGKPYRKKKAGPPVSDRMVAGYTADLASGAPTVFDYTRGAEGLPPMPAVMEERPMSLWNVAQEVHTGRIYDALSGPVAPLFIFLAGTSAIAVLVSGLILYRRRRPSKK